MRAVLFRPKDGEITVEEVPAPRPGPGQVLVRNHFSLISAGTERARLETGRESLIGKARRRPDQVKLVLDNLRLQGPLETWKVVSDRLSSPMLTGYSTAGTVVEVGSDVDDLRPGQLVACAGAGYANHADLVVVPRNLCAAAPAQVSPRDAAFATVGAIALQGVHQAGVAPGSRIVVIGLGLVGQITLQLCGAYGYDAIGIDADMSMVTLAVSCGGEALLRSEPQLAERLEQQLGGAPDAVLITAATQSTDPVELAGTLARDRGQVVVVGDVAVAPPRATYYEKELTLTYSRSYGPGRYDPLYEEGGIDYPEGYVPWDERRNLSEILRLVGRQRLDFEALGPVVFPVEQAAEAFSMLTATGAERRVAVLISYGGESDASGFEADHGSASANGTRPAGAIDLLSPSVPAPAGSISIGAVGAGSFGARMLLPYLKANPAVSFSFIASHSGASAVHQGRRFGFRRAVAELGEGLSTGDTDAVMILTRHDSHARYVCQALHAGAAVYCEKPIALTEHDLDTIASAWLEADRPAMVGFNRRFAPAVSILTDILRGRHAPVQVVLRVFAGQLKPDYWLLQPDQGGRILGEACHFVDLANWLVGAPAVEVTASSLHGADPVRTQSVSVLLSYADGSSATIAYSGDTPRAAPKELIEVATVGVAARIDDFRSLRIWGRGETHKTFRGGPKGHKEEMAAFVDLLAGKAAPATDFPLALWSSLATCRLGDAITSGGTVKIAPSGEALARALLR
jgi:predicted dehydrogenase/NADPH:quinone reductase-like Zn-dependent oxidoreductase